MSSNEALKPCPFNCGHPLPPVPSGYMLGTAEELETATDQWAYSVRCYCGAKGPERDSEAASIEAWNTRSTDTPVCASTDLVERLRSYAPYSLEGKPFGPKFCEEAASRIEQLEGRELALVEALEAASKRLNTIAGVRWAADKFDPYDLPSVETLRTWASEARAGLARVA